MIDVPSPIATGNAQVLGERYWPYPQTFTWGLSVIFSFPARPNTPMVRGFIPIP